MSVFCVLSFCLMVDPFCLCGFPTRSSMYDHGGNQARVTSISFGREGGALMAISLESGEQFGLSCARLSLKGRSA